MQLKKILFPTDFSPASDAGMTLATMLARDTGATLVILHVEEPPMADGGGELYYGVPEPNTDALQKMLTAVKPSDANVKFAHRMVTGDPATEIVRVANEEAADIIVVGTHGRTGLTRLLMGSVAEQVIRHAACPVLTFKEPRQEKK
jgi:nucleotide-binding universal stress UspA family protein